MINIYERDFERLPSLLEWIEHELLPRTSNILIEIFDGKVFFRMVLQFFKAECI